MSGRLVFLVVGVATWVPVVWAALRLWWSYRSDTVGATKCVTNMREAEPGDSVWVYPLPSEWHGEYAWTTDVSAEFDDIYEPVTINRQRWVLVDVETVIFHPRHELCPECNGDGGVGGSTCPTCDGSGEHLMAGQIEVAS